jgi:hypothetical protein
MTRRLFYPSCGRTDLIRAVEGFVDKIDEVHGADISGQITTQFHDRWNVCRKQSRPYSFPIEWQPNGPRGIRHLLAAPPPLRPTFQRNYSLDRKDDPKKLEFIWHQYDAVEALRVIPSIAVFFARGDRSIDGEGSSGIRWLDDVLLRRVLTRMDEGGLFVTDGLRMEDSAVQSPLWSAPWNTAPTGITFSVFERRFECTTVFDDKRPATLVWKVHGPRRGV